MQVTNTAVVAALKLTMSQLARLLPAKHLGADSEVDHITTDSRKLQPGEIFLALSGEKFDGHNFICQAIAKQAGGLIVAESFINQQPNFKPKLPTLVVQDTLLAYGKIAELHRNCYQPLITAITGSCGKTSVKEMLTTILQQCGTVLASSANFNNEIGLPFTLLQLTPQHQYVVLEMGARKSGDIAYLMAIAKPKISLINNVWPAHLETFKNLDGIAHAKGEIYLHLDPQGIGVLNVDDVYAPYWLSLLKKQQIITFGIAAKADVTAYNIVFNDDNNSTCFELVIDEKSIKVQLPALGIHQVRNALAAAACAHAQKITLADIVAGLAKFNLTTRRGNIKAGANGAVVIDDSYNANPGSVKAGLAVLAAKPGKKIFVMGDMLELGAADSALHQVIGEYAKELQIDYLLGYGKLCSQVVRAFCTQGGYSKYAQHGEHYTDKSALIADLLRLMDANTTVLVKGSNSMRMDEVVQGIVLGGNY